jgi:energy-coupling factor transport system permease protein
MRRRGTINAVAWALWLTAVVLLLSLTRNPLYIGLVLLWVAVVTGCATLVQPLAPPILSPWRFGLVVVPTAALINGLNVHVGATVLLTLPPTLPLIGGPITLEALVYGAVNGLAITTLLAAFTLVTRVLTVHEVIGLIPRAYYPVAVVATIALTFAPLTLRQWQAIREAQAVRGHQMRGVRDWLPLFLPLLLSGLERALQLAEAMTARGFGDTAGQPLTPLTRVGLVMGLSSVVGGLWLRLSGEATTADRLLVLGGVGLVIILLWLVGRRSVRTHYRPAPLQATDWAVIGGALATALLFLLPWPGLDRAALFFYPYPALTMPGVGLPLALATWGLLTPAFVLVRHYATKVQKEQA